MNDKPISEQRVMVIEPAGFFDARFYGTWLLSLVNAAGILATIRSSDFEFNEKIEDLEWAYPLDLAAAGALIVTHLAPEFPLFVVDLDEELFESD